MRWYSPNDWILGPETAEEIEEFKRIRQETQERLIGGEDTETRGNVQ